MLWYNDGVEFSTKITKLNYIVKNEQSINKEYDKMIDMQEKILMLDIEEMEIIEEVNKTLNENETIESSKKKEKRKKKKE